MSQSVLILGANGRFGRNASASFHAAGWHVTQFDRARDNLTAAAQGKDIIVNGWNPGDYSTWHREMMPLHQAVIQAAQSSGSTVILPGNVYVFGEHTPAPWSPMTPHNAQNPLGKLRKDMEVAYRASGIRVINLRAGDYLDTQASGNWFDLLMVAKLAKGVFQYPGDPSVQHAWAYLPDLTRAAVKLAEDRMELPRYAEVCFPGYSLSGHDIVKLLEEILDRDIRLSRIPIFPMRVLAVFNRFYRGPVEMSYLWRTPHTLDGQSFQALLPNFASTPPKTALTRAIAHIHDASPQSGGRPKLA